MAKVSQAEPQGLANTAWAFAVLAKRHKPLLDAIAAASVAIMPNLGPRSSANILWAFALLVFQHQPLIASISSTAMDTLQEFQGQSLSNTAWSLAAMRDRNERPLLEAISEEVGRRGLRNFLGSKHSYAVLWAAWVSSEAGRPLLDSAIDIDLFDSLD